jgi:microcin C transport system substrate-binding protein
MFRLFRLIAFAAIASIGLHGTAAPASDDTPWVHAIAMYGEPKYPPGFTHFDYADPDAIKGGLMRQHAIGTFDSLNPFILRGVPAAGLGNVYETLTAPSLDEAFTQYGRVAEAIQVPADRSWVAFRLRAEARWHDGTPITPEDVVFTLDTLKTKGHPFYRAYYANLKSAEKTGERTVRITFDGGDNRELPLIAGQMQVLPKHYWEGRDFQKTTLEAPLGSGPYTVDSFEPGRSIEYVRIKDHWAANLPTSRGINNWDRLRIDYYRDSTVALEAFKAGEYDLRLENEARNWATGYEGPALDKGHYKLETIRHELPTGMQGFAFNTRRPIFSDPRVRRALAHAFNFEWANKNLFYGQYTRTESYFSNSELASRGLPEGLELAVLERLRGRVPDEVFTTPYQPPKGSEDGNMRDNLLAALDLLKSAGWDIKGRSLVNGKTGEPFRFEILNNQPTWERIILPYVRNLERLGIEVTVRTVDTAQYQHREDNFDFDMTVGLFGQSLSPGNEQRDFWGSAAAKDPGSRNIIGISDPVIDELIDLVIAAPDRDSLIARTRALDRVLLWHHFIIPHWHLSAFRIADWDIFKRPPITPKYGLGVETWWIDPDKAAALRAARGR